MLKRLATALVLSAMLCCFPGAGQAVEQYAPIGNGDVPSHAGRATRAGQLDRRGAAIVPNTGLTPEQLDEAVIILGERVGEAPGMLARATLDKVLAERAAKPGK